MKGWNFGGQNNWLVLLPLNHDMKASLAFSIGKT